MSPEELAVIETSIQKTHIWLKEIMESLGWEDRHKAYIALRAVLHALRDRLPKGEAVQLGAQFPILISGIYYEGWKIRERGIKRQKKEFFSKIAAAFLNEPGIQVEKIVQGVFSVIAKHVTEGEIEDIEAVLPKELKEYWPDKKQTEKAA